MLYYVDTDSFIVNSKSEHIYADPAGEIKRRFDTSNHLTTKNEVFHVTFTEDILNRKLLLFSHL